MFRLRDLLVFHLNLVTKNTISMNLKNLNLMGIILDFFFFFYLINTA